MCYEKRITLLKIKSLVHIRNVDILFEQLSTHSCIHMQICFFFLKTVINTLYNRFEGLERQSYLRILLSHCVHLSSEISLSIVQ